MKESFKSSNVEKLSEIKVTTIDSFQVGIPFPLFNLLYKQKIKFVILHRLWTDKYVNQGFE